MTEVLLLASFSLLMQNHCRVQGTFQPKRIAGGNNVMNNKQFPFFVQIFILSEIVDGSARGLGRGGSLIHQRWILTSAHCFKEADIDNLGKRTTVNFTAGTIITDDVYGKMNWATKVILHPQFKVEYYQNHLVKTMKNDIALCKLSNPYKLSISVNIAYLPRLNKLPRPQSSRCRTGIILGTGRTNIHGNAIFKPVLQYATIKSLTYKEISNGAEPPKSTVFYTITKPMQGHSLPGDSGGPYVCYKSLRGKPVPVIYGICSTGTDTTNQGYNYILAIYEEVDRHIDFIAKHVKLKYFDEVKQLRMGGSAEPRFHGTGSNGGSAISSFSLFAFVLFVMQHCDNKIIR